MIRSLARAVFGLTVLAWSASSNGSIIEIYNGESEPATSPIGLTFAGNNIGWYYTPADDYLLTRIETKFNQPFTDQHTDQLVTVTIYTERLVLGGVALESGEIKITPTGFGVTAPFQGAEITPTLLTAGTQYFIGFSGVQSEGVNVASWYNLNGVPTLQGDKTLSAYYLGSNYSQEFTELYLNGPNGSTPVGRAPILRFNGELVPSSVPEPGTLTLAGLGALGLIGSRLRRRCTPTEAEV